MKTVIRATKTSQLLRFVLDNHAQGQLAWCNGSWWRCRTAPSAPHTRWFPATSADLLSFVPLWAAQEAAQMFDPDFDTLAAELTNLRNLELFLRQLRTPLTVESLNG